MDRAQNNNPMDPHAGSPVLTAGLAPQDASAALVLLHGRGASAQSILSVFDALDLKSLAAVAPQAAGFTWYPQSFLAPLESNQPFLDSALQKVKTVVDELLLHGIPSERIAILGFSQGACLTCEFVARNARRYGAVMALTGGLIGPPGTPRDYRGSLDGTPAFLGTSDPDPHVPFERVLETQRVLTTLGGVVEVRRYPGMPHSINNEELTICRGLLEELIGTS